MSVLVAFRSSYRQFIRKTHPDLFYTNSDGIDISQNIKLLQYMNTLSGEIASRMSLGSGDGLDGPGQCSINEITGPLRWYIVDGHSDAQDNSKNTAASVRLVQWNLTRMKMTTTNSLLSFCKSIFDHSKVDTLQLASLLSKQKTPFPSACKEESDGAGATYGLVFDSLMQSPKCLHNTHVLYCNRNGAIVPQCELDLVRSRPQQSSASGFSSDSWKSPATRKKMHRHAQNELQLFFGDQDVG